MDRPMAFGNAIWIETRSLKVAIDITRENKIAIRFGLRPTPQNCEADGTVGATAREKSTIQKSSLAGRQFSPAKSEWCPAQ
jgi:hypothetical protein